MAAKLDFDILEQNFELIRDRIAIILKEELANQATRQTNPDLDPYVYTERFSPISKEEEKVLVISIDRLSFDSETQVSQKSSTIYNIDVYTFSKQDDNQTGYYSSSKKLQRLAGLIRAILENPVYNKLDFTPGFINRTSIFEIIFDDGGRNEDASFLRMCRVRFRVEHNEEQLAKAPLVLNGHDTKVYIEETDKGYLFIINT